mmetsp:Transcript_57673/g.185309  ORF Transcript_57673/g.185309 Transcript_57673/m.185309 type:complete len:248 (-) Transcript_57673:137-880(-)
MAARQGVGSTELCTTLPAPVLHHRREHDAAGGGAAVLRALLGGQLQGAALRRSRPHRGAGRERPGCAGVLAPLPHAQPPHHQGLVAGLGAPVPAVCHLCLRPFLVRSDGGLPHRGFRVHRLPMRVSTEGQLSQARGAGARAGCHLRPPEQRAGHRADDLRRGLRASHRTPQPLRPSAAPGCLGRLTTAPGAGLHGHSHTGPPRAGQRPVRPAAASAPARIGQGRARGPAPGRPGLLQRCPSCQGPLH